MKHLIILILFISLSACGVKVRTQLGQHYPALNPAAEITVLGMDQKTPPNATELGTVRISDTGFTLRCNWEIVIEKAKTEARKAGGNFLKITEYDKPDLMSSCHRITATILRIEDPNEKKN